MDSGNSYGVRMMTKIGLGDLQGSLSKTTVGKRLSLEEVIKRAERRVTRIKLPKKRLSVEEQIKKDFALFEKVGRSGLQIDLLKALREDRGRDNA